MTRLTVVGFCLTSLLALTLSAQSQAQDQRPEFARAPLVILYTPSGGPQVDFRAEGALAAQERRDTAGQDLANWSNEPGLAGAAARLAEYDLRQRTSNDDALGTLTWKRVIYNINLELGTASFDVTATRQENGQEVTRRWVMAVCGGLKVTRMNPPMRNHNDSSQPFNWKINASGTTIEMIAYYENGELIRALDDDNNFTDAGRVYWSDARSCLDVFTVDQPQTGGELQYDSDIDGIRDTTGMCFGRCTSPGVIATNM